MSNKVTPATLSTQKEIISALNSQSILLQLSYAQNKSIPRIKQELLQQLFYVSQETALKAKFDFQTNSENTLLADGKWNHAKHQQHGGEEDIDSFDEEEDGEEEIEEDRIIEEDDDDAVGDRHVEEDDNDDDDDDDDDDGHEHEHISESTP